MNNLISIFMNYKINRLVEYGVFVVQKDTPFIRQVFTGYFSTYVDNYYYNIFNTVEEEKFNEKNLKLEFKGIKEEMLDDYRAYELQVSNEEYSENRKAIEDLHDIAYELLKIDELAIDDKDVIASKVDEYLKAHPLLKELVGNRESQLAKLVKDTFQTCTKMLSYEDNYYHIEEKKFMKNDKMVFLNLVPNIKVLEVYRKSRVQKIYRDKRLSLKKLENAIQKVSFDILKKTLNHEDIPLIFLEFYDEAITRGKIIDSIYDLIDNPLFRKYVVLTVNFNLYGNQKEAFSEDFQFACIQDFTHINDIYQKTESIFQEGIFRYLIVSDYRFQDKEFFMGFESSDHVVLMFEEE